MSNSDVLDAFAAALAAQDHETAEVLHRECEAALVDTGEKELAIRCLTAAAQVWRESVNAGRTAARIADGSQAFEEWQLAGPVVVDGPREQLQKSLRETMLFAADRLGPFPGGEPGSFKAPEAAPRVVREVVPTTVDLVDIARHAGATVGIAANLSLADSLAIFMDIAGAQKRREEN